MSWSTSAIPDLSGKTAAITGVTGGLGLNAAIELGRHGASLLVTARDDAKAAQAVARIAKDAPGTKVEVVELDLADLAQTKKAAAGLVDTVEHLDILINNAGVMATPKRLTVDGFELQMGTNHLGHFAWTATLWPLLKTSNTTVVSVASLAHTMVKGIDLRSLTTPGSPRRYRRWQSYGESKLANLLFAFELDRRAKAAGLGVVSVAAHPGLAFTNLTAAGPTLGGNSLPAKGMHQIVRIVRAPASMGAWPLLMAATDSELSGGEYVGPSRLRQMRGAPRLVGASGTARDAQLADILWTASESAVGTEFTV
ncbi:MAG: SDR family NAD(P)-dependent oxidoreductase [Kineosporiaceae bacterium]|nr:SDR family NAD(P)-dependent oxidoreductase [Aeromicrobium sp.]